MNNQTPIQISVEETKAVLERHFATITGNLIMQSLALEKQIAILQTSIAQLEAEIVDLNPHRATMSREAAGIAGSGDKILRENQKGRPD